MDGMRIFKEALPPKQWKLKQMRKPVCIWLLVFGVLVIGALVLKALS